MNQRPTTTRTSRASRREFVRRSLTAGAGTGLAGQVSAGAGTQTAGDEVTDVIRIALIGCGGRGTGAAVNALRNAAGAKVRLVAMVDAFSKPLDRSLQAIQRRCSQRVDVPTGRKFVGLDAYQKAIDSGIDMVLLCTPPGFRPIHYEAAAEAGKHVFMEKPVAVDPSASAESSQPTRTPRSSTIKRVQTSVSAFWSFWAKG